MRLDDESEAELRQIVLRLEQLVPGDTAHLTIPADAEGKTSAGNRAGYLRFGLAFLRAALDPLPANDAEPARIAPELDGLLSRGSRGPFELCEIDESIVSRPPVSSGLGAPGQLASAVLVVALLLLCLIGASVVWRWFFG
jgi:hypothetical protein